MDYDAILEYLGETSRFNVINICLGYLPAFLGGMTVLVYSLAGMEPNAYRCRIPECSADDGDFTSVGGPDLFPLDDDGNPDYCRYYPVVEPLSNGSCPLSVFDLSGSPVKCDPNSGFVYDDFEMEETVVTEFDLVCDDQFKVALTSSIYMSGLLVGSSALGWLGDIVGRRWILIIGVLLCCIPGVVGAFVPNYALYCATRFVAGMGQAGGVIAGFVTAVELSGKRTKAFFGIMVQTPFALGEALVAAIAIGVRDWRTYQIVTAAPMIIVVLIYFVIPESPRWLLKTGRYEQFVDTIRRAAKMNKVTVPEHLLEVSEGAVGKVAEGEELPEASLGISALFANRTVSKITIIMWISWIAISIGYYGISLGIGDIGTDALVNFVLVSLIEIPSYIFSVLTIDHLGRRTLFSFCLLLLGSCCMAAAFLEAGIPKTVLALFGKFGAAAAFAVAFLYVGELYPTEIRSTAVGMCSTLSRIGGIAAPQIVLYLPSLTFAAFPLVFIGIFGLVSGLLAVALPETLGSSLVESLEDINEMGKDTKSFLSWWSTKKLREHSFKNVS